MAIEKKSFVMPRAVWTSIDKMRKSGVISFEVAGEMLDAAINYGLTGSLPPEFKDSSGKFDMWDYGFEMIKTLIDNANQDTTSIPITVEPIWKPAPKITCDDKVTNIPNNQKRINWSDTTAVHTGPAMPVTYCTCDDKYGEKIVESKIKFNNSSELEDFFVNKY